MDIILAIVAAVLSMWGIAVVIGAMSMLKQSIYLQFAVVAAALGWVIIGLVIAGL